VPAAPSGTADRAGGKQSVLVRVAAILVAVAVAMEVETAVAAPRSFVIQGDYNIGGFRVKVDGSLGGAIDALGSPSSRRLRNGVCYVAWSGIGVRMQFYNLGGGNPCGFGTGRFSNATITGARWRTSKSLRIGDTEARVRRLYPLARFHSDRFHGPGWWLVVRYSTIGDGGNYPGLMARVRSGRVSALVVRYAAGGD
jgi:hypothetical protein